MSYCCRAGGGWRYEFARHRHRRQTPSTSHQTARLYGALPTPSPWASRGVRVSLGDTKSSLGDAESSLGDAESLLGDGKSSLGDTKSSLGDAKSSLGDAKSSLGDAESSRGDA